MPFLVYAPTALALLWLMHRFIRPVGRMAGVILFLLPLLFTGRALLQNRVFAPIDHTYGDPPLVDLKGEYGIGDGHNQAVSDIYSQMIPWRHVVRESLAHGEWPLWNPFILCGDILAASAQAAPYSPFTLVACLLPAALSFTFTAAITFFLAGAAAFAFARELGCRESVSLVAAGGWMSTACMVLYVLWPLGLCWALLPLVLVATRRVVAEPGLASWALLTTSFTLLILAGHPESVLHIVTVGAVYGLFELVQRRRLSALATAVAAGATALLLCAIYLLPIVDAIPQTAEYSYRKYLFAKADRGASPADLAVRLATDAFPFLHLKLVKTPPMTGLKGETAAAGSIVLALALYAVWRVRSRLTWFFAAMAAFCLAAGAEWGPIIKLFQQLPLFDIALHERFAFAAAFFLVLLATLGLEHILATGDRRAAALSLAVTCIALAIGTWWIRHAWVILDGPATWGRYKIVAELAILAIASIVVAFRVPLAPIFLALLLVQRVASEGGVWRSFPARAAYPPVPLFEPLKNVREPFRVVGHGFALIPGTNALYGLEDVRGYEAMTNARFAYTWWLWCEPQTVFFNRVDDLSKPLLSMMNVRFAVAGADAPIPNGWREIARQPKSVLLENANVLPRAFVPRHVTIGLQDGLSLDEMNLVTDFRERAWITENIVPKLTSNGSGRVSIRRPRFGEYALDADMDATGWVVISESGWNGWRAYLDGRRVAVRRANVAFLGVLVPAGKHHVRLVYRPRSFDVGLKISIATVLGLVAFWLVRRRTRRRPEVA